MGSDRHISAETIKRFNLPQPQRMQADKTLFVEKCPLDFSPLLAAHHVLRAAVQAGCGLISVRRGRWRYEFKVTDLVSKGIIVSKMNDLEALGTSALKMKLCGDEFDRMKGPQTQVHVRPPWNQSKAFGKGDGL